MRNLLARKKMVAAPIASDNLPYPEKVSLSGSLWALPFAEVKPYTGLAAWGARCCFNSSESRSDFRHQRTRFDELRISPQQVLRQTNSEKQCDMRSILSAYLATGYKEHCKVSIWSTVSDDLVAIRRSTGCSTLTFWFSSTASARSATQ